MLSLRDKYRKVVAIWLMVLVIGGLLTTKEVKADIGPKPSVVIDFAGLKDTTYYVTLLSDRDSTGPHSSYMKKGSLRYNEDDPRYEMSRKFIEYQDRDGFYYLQYLKKCYDNESFSWTYYPPSRFKILIYIPESDLMIESDEIYERYAFDSYYKATVRLDEQSVNAVESQMEVERSYHFWAELGKVIFRALLTIAVEVMVAVIFLYTEKHDFHVIVKTNLFTQMCLNLAVNFFLVKYGFISYILIYLLLEFLVFAIEAWIYKKYFSNERLNRKRWSGLPVLYAFFANALSFGFGIYLGYVSSIRQFF